MAGCEQFALGSRTRQICDGESELSLSRTNKFRAMYAIAPLNEVESGATVANAASGQRVAVTTMRMRSPAKAKRCCGGGVSKSPATQRIVEGTGVGGRLIEIFKAHGFETCEACYELAHKMNEWGAQGCRERLDVIVSDIMPRALAWESAKVGWWASLLPEAVTAKAVRMIVERAIDTAKPLEWMPVEMPQPIVTARQSKASRRGDQFVRRPNGSGMQVVPSGPAIQSIDTTALTRHLTFHVYPVKNFGAWQWNCDRLIEAADLFNGRRIVAIATDDTTDSAEEVKQYLANFTDDFIVIKNNPVIREVATFAAMLTKLQDYQSANDVTLSCHAKGVRHKLVPDDSDGSTVFKWTRALWKLSTHWPTIAPLLETHAIAGSFRRYAQHLPKLGFGPWHYSGTFYWWRNRDAFARRWHNIPKTFVGTEAWPGLLFTKSEAAVILGEDVQDLYRIDYWNKTIEPQLAEWEAKHGRIPALVAR